MLETKLTSVPLSSGVAGMKNQRGSPAVFSVNFDAGLLCVFQSKYVLIQTPLK